MSISYVSECAQDVQQVLALVWILFVCCLNAMLLSCVLQGLSGIVVVLGVTGIGVLKSVNEAY